MMKKKQPKNDQSPASGGQQDTSDEDIEALRRTAVEYGLEFLTTVPDEILNADLVANLSVDWARSNCLLPVQVGDETCVLTADPKQVGQQEYLSLLVGHELRPIMAPGHVILRSIERCYYQRDDSPGAFLAGMGDVSVGEDGQGARSDDLLRVAEAAPVTQLVNLILLEAVKSRASDIHFEPFESRLRIRYRIDGVLYEQTSPPRQLAEALVSRLKVMARMDIAEKRLPQDGMARVRVGEREIDIRVSTVPAAEGERVVLRLLDRDSALLPLGDLGLPAVLLPRWEALLNESNGIVVVCGPTGSGKTTTLYAALTMLDASRKNILTIEDPIEYQLPDIGQIQVKPKIGLTFANGLKHILRQDPDIILVGETRDLETAEIAVRAALTGHLVLTTLHTNDAIGSVLRLMDMGVEAYLLASCLRGVLAQRLVRCLCPECSREVQVDFGRLGALEAAGEPLKGKLVREAVGCDRCIEGYNGRTGLFELLEVDAETADAIGAGSLDRQALRRVALGDTLLDDGVGKILRGVTSLSEVLSVTG